MSLKTISVVLGFGFGIATTTPPSAFATETGAFDGLWNVTVACSDVGDVKGYHWHFPARVRSGELSGRIDNPDTSWGALSGKIENDGTARLTMVGNTGDPVYSIAHVKVGSAINYHVNAHFDAQSGSGKRVELRPCDLTFTKN